MSAKWRLAVALLVATCVMLGAVSAACAEADKVAGGCMMGGLLLYLYGSDRTSPSAAEVLNGADPFGEHRSDSAMVMGEALFAYGAIRSLSHRHSDTSLVSSEAEQPSSRWLVGFTPKDGSMRVGWQTSF